MRTTTLSITVPLLLSTLTSALTLDCSHIRVDNKKFNLEKLGGPHSITHVDKSRPPSIHNTTYTVDICNQLDRDADVPKEEQCPRGTYVCGIESSYNPVDDSKIIVESVIPIAGNYETSNGKGLEPKFERLKSKDTQAEGLLMEIHGGQYAKKNQKAVIKFECDLDRTGNEGFEAAEGNMVSEGATGLLGQKGANATTNFGAFVRDDDPEDDKRDDSKSLTFVSYGAIDDKTDVLSLNWRTKYACEDFEDDDDDGPSSKSSHWGFFTWFIIIAFLGIATYLIFGSWLNYNRYGARGWDLLPHGDTIRDIPYLFKDWSKKVVDTVQGGGSRGGYSAV